jgi:hypothetical protein
MKSKHQSTIIYPVEFCETMYVHYSDRLRNKLLPRPVRHFLELQQRYWLDQHEAALPIACILIDLFKNQNNK